MQAMAQGGGWRAACSRTTPRFSSSPAQLASRPSSPSLFPARRTLLRAARPLGSRTTAAAAARGPVELLLDNVAGKSELLSPKLDPELRRRTVQAIKQRGGRVTIGDVASTAGLKLDQAEDAVRALASDSQATLQVSDAGDIVYVFSPGFQETITSKSLLLRVEPVVDGVKVGAEYVARVAFGTALIASVVIVFAAITVLANSGRDDNRRSNSGGGGVVFGGGGGRSMFSDMLWYWDPFYFRHRQQRVVQQQRQGGMNFLEAIFSWVFGDGDPNADFDAKRWQSIGRYIAGRGGTVVAEELAPFLDLKPGELASDRNRVTVDESYMVPVLARFNGTPGVDAQGNIVYTFPDLQTTATASRAAAVPADMALEQPLKLTAASQGQKLGAVALGAVNLLGVGALSLMLVDPINQMALARNGLLGVVSLMPFLQAYAAAFFAVPLFRWLRIKAQNAAIEARNQARKAARALLQQPDPVLQQKLAGAARGARRNVIRERDAVYRSDRGLEKQPTDIEADNFDARLEQRTRERQQTPPSRASPQWWRDQQAQRQRDRTG
ncbi:hypothetical protein D9Q98_009269 [Chlorella vulgaris]|uniref:Iron-sulfur cluster biosynthesis family n=1 Tax=Chlorella vulgaris TaxID=3077 RepID=A0A9D4TP45_CHLVU|nr:hypothetical protein D9Q98_009269 [Chlorella vulgaris]